MLTHRGGGLDDAGRDGVVVGRVDLGASHDLPQQRAVANLVAGATHQVLDANRADVIVWRRGIVGPGCPGTILDLGCARAQRPIPVHKPAPTHSLLSELERWFKGSACAHELGKCQWPIPSLSVFEGTSSALSLVALRKLSAYQCLPLRLKSSVFLLGILLGTLGRP